MSDFESQFAVLENDDAERYEFHSKDNSSCSYTVSYEECAGYLSRAWRSVRLAASAAKTRSISAGVAR